MEPNNQWVDDRLEKLNPEDDWQPRLSTALTRFESRRAQRKAPRIIPVAIVAAVCVLTFPAPRALAQRVITPCLEACQNLVLSPPDVTQDIHQMIWFFHSWMGFAPPDFALTDASGASFRLSDNFGKVVLLNFWATWCAPCKQEIPWFVEFQRTFKEDGFAVIGVSLDQDGWKAVRPVIQAEDHVARLPWAWLGDAPVSLKAGNRPSCVGIARSGCRRHINVAAAGVGL